jgi:signal peptidase I
MAKKPKNSSKISQKNSQNGNGKPIAREIATYIIIIILGIIMAQHLNVVVSGSMEPVFYRGDVVLIEKSNFLGLEEINPNNLKVGDIIIYHATWFPEPVIHRIIDTGQTANGKTYYVTKGDNNPRQDPALVSTEQVQAKVVSLGTQPVVIPKIGYITLWIRGL